MGQRNCDLLRQVTSQKRFYTYEIFYGGTKKGDLLIQVTAWTGLTAYIGHTYLNRTNKTDCHDITEILLKVALNTINETYKYS